MRSFDDMLSKQLQDKEFRKEYEAIQSEMDDTITAISKPVNGAFVLSKQKASEFFENKVKTSSDAIRRLENRKAEVTSKNGC